MKIIKSFIFLAIATMGTLSANGQDLLARQAPIDRKMKAVDSVALQRLIDFETNYGLPADDLYDDWDNSHAHSRVSEMPDSFRISLKNFCTASRRASTTASSPPSRW